MYFHPDIRTFRLVVKQLEESKKFIGKSEVVYSRMAIILIDNVIEILLVDFLNQEIESSYKMSWAYKFDFSSRKIDLINKYFDEKIKAIKKLGFVNDDDASILKTIHTYRNLIYHQGFHNPVTVDKFAELYFMAASRLFARIYSSTGLSIWGGGEKWLRGYGLKIDHINFKEASERITSYLLNGFYISLSTIKKMIFEDLNFRINQIILIRKDELPWLKNDFIFDAHLKVAEYFDENRYLLKECYNSLYEFLKSIDTSKDEDNLKKWLKIKLEAKQIDEKIEKALNNFKQTISSQIPKQSLGFLRKIKNYHKINKLLEKYCSIDKDLLKIELYLNQLMDEFDEEMSKELDLIRGK